jgi:hypothetical protein
MTQTASAFTPYDDIRGHWAAGAINRWNNLGFIDSGVFEGEAFLPNQHISRLEFFSLIVRAMGATTLGDPSRFSDIDDLPANQRDVITIANQMGVANGFPDGTMRPNGTLLRQDAAVLLANTVGMSSVADWVLSRFHDGNFIGNYARSAVSSLVEKGVISGYPDGSFRPRGFLTRAQAITMLDNMFTNVYSPESLFSHVYLQGDVLMRTPGAVMSDSFIDGDVVVGDGVGNGDVTIANSTISGRLVIRGGGPRSVILSNAHVAGGIYVASFGTDTHISITNGSTVPILEAISGFTLSGSGVQDVTILENVRRGSIVNLTGVNLIDVLTRAMLSTHVLKAAARTQGSLCLPIPQSGSLRFWLQI